MALAAGDKAASRKPHSLFIAGPIGLKAIVAEIVVSVFDQSTREASHITLIQQSVCSGPGASPVEFRDDRSFVLPEVVNLIDGGKEAGRNDSIFGAVEACKPAFERPGFDCRLIDNASDISGRELPLMKIDLCVKEIAPPGEAKDAMIEVVAVTVNNPQVGRRRNHAQLIEAAAPGPAVGTNEPVCKVVITRGRQHKVGVPVERSDQRPLSHHALACHKERIDGQQYSFFCRHVCNYRAAPPARAGAN